MKSNSRINNRGKAFDTDLLIMIVSGIAIFSLAIIFQFGEKLQLLLIELEHLQLDEFFVAIIGVTIVNRILLVRRWRILQREIAHNQEAARGLAQERILLRTVVDHLPDYIFVKDREGRYILSNIAHARAAKNLPEELLGKRAYDVFPPELAAQYRMDDETIMRSQQPLINVERVTVDETGNRRQVLTTKVPVMDSSGEVIGLVGISRDITHRKREEQQALELAGERERVKMMSAFTRDAAHDFRTPLATISTSLYLLQKNIDPAQRQRHAETIEGAVQRLSQLLNGLTTMTRLEGMGDLDASLIQINDLLQSVISNASSLARHPNIQLKVDLQSDLPVIPGSEDELHLAFLNLIDNAARFTPDGGLIAIRTMKKEHQLVVEVRDNGVGISPSDLEHIFDRFYRTDRARASETGGIGLGLSIAKKIVDLHHGSIEAESTPGEGSTFRIFLPVYDPLRQPSR